MAGTPPGTQDEGSSLRAALQGVTYLTDAIKGNPNMIEILAALFQKHPTLRLIWLAASRHPERLQRKAQGLPQEPARVPPLLGA